MARVRVVLVCPENPANIGATARAIMNTGLDGLDLVAPGDWRTIETWRTAWRAEDILEQARVFDSVDEAVAESVYVAGMAGRSGMRVQPSTPREMAAEISALGADTTASVVFGSESHGLTEKDLRSCHRRVSIPSHPRQPSLNLAQAVMVTGYELFVSHEPAGEARERAPHRDVEQALESLRASFIDLGFVTEESAGTRFSEWRELFGRAGLSSHESRMVLALARKIKNVSRIANERKR